MTGGEIAGLFDSIARSLLGISVGTSVHGRLCRPLNDPNVDRYESRSGRFGYSLLTDVGPLPLTFHYGEVGGQCDD